ncbi:MAG: prolyl oligopeptidase family serine peptidase, partial [Candidatus Kapaibacterium sp.]
TSDVKVGKSVKDMYPKLDKAEARIFTDSPIRHWDEWEDENYSHLFIMPADGGEAIDLMEGEKYDTPMKPFGGSGDIAWSPDSKEIAYTSKKVAEYAKSTDSDIYIVDIATRTTREITVGMDGFDMHPLYSPDGKWIAFHSMERPGFEADRVRLMLFDRKTGNIKELPKNLDQWVDQFVWSPNSDAIYFSSGVQGIVPIFRLDVATGKWEQLTKGMYNWDYGLDVTPDGSTLVFGKRNMLRPPEYYKYELKNKRETQLTHANDDIYEDLAPAEIKEEWITSFDGSQVHCWVLYPPDFRPNKKYPMITYCQGGPQSMIAHYFSFRWNLYLMASEGYIVVAPNRRGVPGFGQEWNDAISGDWAGKPMQDILAATDEFRKRDYIDTNAIAAVGASAGGYAAFWLAGNHEGRFSAFISHCGVFNLESMYGATEELWFPNWEYGGPYWKPENKEFYKKNSPHEFAANWDTPIMITTGQYDFRVPYTQSLEAYQVAQVKGIPSKLIIFPEENHWILSLHNALLWQNEFFGFLKTHCKSK